MSDNSFKEQRKALRRARKIQRREISRGRRRSGSVLAGLLLLGVGAILLLKEFGFTFPAWLFTWPMILVAFGLFAGAGNAFRDPGWIVITGIGVVFLLDKIWPNIPIYHFIWPVVIIAIGLMMIVVPRRHRIWHEKFERKWGQYYEQGMQHKWDQYYKQEGLERTDIPTDATGEAMNQNPEVHTGGDETKYQKRNDGNWLDVVSIFGNIKKIVYSKNFRGGDIVSIFGGAEVNLTQADFEGKIVIEMVQVFGGAKLIVPPHWQIRSEIVAVFGGIEDKRTPQANYDNNKVVILNGTTFFGGIEIKSY